MRWITADIVFDGYDFHRNFFVQVDENARIITLQNEHPEGPVDYYTGLLMPGMINAHCHLELSYLKDLLPRQTGIVEFLQLVRAQFDKIPDSIALNEMIAAADSNMRANGIVAVGDICNTTNTILCKKNSAIHYHNFIECIAIREADVAARFQSYYEVYQQFDKNGLIATLGLHAPYTCHSQLYQLVKQHADFITIHNQESDAENILFHRKQGAFDSFYEHFGLDKNAFVSQLVSDSSFEHSLALLGSDRKKLFVHNTFTSKDDLAKADENTWFCFCPNANLYIEGQLPQIENFEDFSNQIVIGTDSLASNSELNILAEVKTIQDNFPDVGLQKILQWATSNGAKLFGLENDLGSLTLGCSPGIVHVEEFDSTGLRLVGTTSKRVV